MDKKTLMQQIHEVYVEITEITGAMVDIEKRELAGENIKLEATAAAIAYQSRLLKLREITSRIDGSK